MKVKKSYYATGGNGSYFEALFNDGSDIILDTVSGITEGTADEEIKDMSITEIVKKYGEGEQMDFAETGISTEVNSEEEVKKYVGVIKQGKGK